MTTDCTQFLGDLDAGVFANKIGVAITNAAREAITFDKEGMVHVKVADLEFDLEAFGPGTTSIAAIRQLDINTATTAGSEVAALSESRLAVPIALVFNLRPFPELAMRRVVVDFGVALSPGEKVPALKLQIRELEALQESIATEFGEVVREALAQLPDSVAVAPVNGAFKW